MGDTLLHKVRATIDRYRMLVTDDTVVLAVSGGIDSMVMLHLLSLLQPCYHLSLHVAHLNHNLRGAESAEAADFVRCRCEAYRVSATVTTAPEGALRGKRMGSLQAVARDLRYRFLDQVANGQGAGRIALGHHRDDQAETVLMNLFRGSGIRGLGGIPPVRGRIIRPLIECSREEIERYARQERIPYVEDSSNLKSSYRRNRIRVELLPELAKRYNPRIIHALANTATILEAEDALLNAMVEKEFRSVLISRSQGALALSGPRMAALPDALRWRLIRRSAEELRGGRAGLTFQQVLFIDQLALARRSQGAVYASDGLCARRTDDVVVVSVGERHVTSLMSAISLAVPGLTVIPGSTLSLRSDILREWSRGELTSDAWTAFLDADRTGKELQVRGWEKGDRFVPLGLSGRKKLQDFFVDAKVPREARGGVPLVVAGGRIAWVVGFRVDERFKVTDSTQRILRLRASATGEHTR